MAPARPQSSPGTSTGPQDPAAAVDLLVEAMCPVETETVHWEHACGRVLAQDLVSDRPSPPTDTSAMDGYAVRLADLGQRTLYVAARVLPGVPAPPLPPGQALAIMTGAQVPAGAEAVIRREDVEEREGSIRVQPGARVTAGGNIRRRGENLAAGETVCSAGTAVGPAVMTALVSFGHHHVKVHRRLRMAVMVTGDELLPPDVNAEDWQIRDSNGPALRTLLGSCPHIEHLSHVHAEDDLDGLAETFETKLRDCDAILLTGGVSAGTHDFVPRILEQAGCRILFHRLPVRPGHPLLAAVGPDGQLVMGLPGNPMSVLATARRFAWPALRHRAGLAEATPRVPAIRIEEHDGKMLELWWYRPVRLSSRGWGELVATRGSGDVVSMARSDGMVELPPASQITGSRRGPWPFYSWSL